MTKRVILKLQPQNPVELEAELGLARGKILSMTKDPSGEISVDFDDSVNWPDAVLKDKLEKAYNRKVK